MLPPSTPPAMKKVLIVSGEASGDQHGAQLVSAVHANNPAIQFLGMGGEHMRAVGVDIRVDANSLAVVGLIEIAQHIAPLYRAWKTLNQILTQETPDLLVLIDYPTFNLMLAKRAKRAGIKVLYYISPQIWAWHQRRVKTIAKRVDKMLVVFPFEETLYRENNVPVEYVGHPLAEKVFPTESTVAMREEWQIPSDACVIGLLPGSRRGEIHRLLPVMLAAARQLQRDNPATVFVLPLANSLSRADIQPYLQDLQDMAITLKVIPGQFYNTVQLCDAAIVASGTATLEVALLAIPMVIIYKMAAITYLLAKWVIQIPHVGLCNIVAGQLIAKELIQHAASADNIAAEIRRIITDKPYRDTMVANLHTVKQKLGEGGGVEKAAQALMAMLIPTAL